jgi:hypothetical protein
LALAYLYTLEANPGLPFSFAQVLREVIRHFQGDLLAYDGWQFHFISVLILGLFPLLMLDWVAIAWLSTWRSLRVKHAIFAPLSALLILHLPPPILFVFTAVQIEKHRLMPTHEFTQAVMLFAITGSYFIANQLLWIWWSRRQIYKHFRAAATDRYQPAPKRRWWQLRVA